MPLYFACCAGIMFDAFGYLNYTSIMAWTYSHDILNYKFQVEIGVATCQDLCVKHTLMVINLVHTMC